MSEEILNLGSTGISSDIDWAAIKAQLQASKAATAASLANNKSTNKTNLKIAQGGWAVSREGIKSQLKIANGQLQFQRDQMEKIGIPAEQAQEWMNHEQVRLADQTFQLSKASLGLEYLKFSSTLSGPNNYFQASNFARGAQASGASAFLQSLQANQQSAAFQGQGPGGPDPLTAASLTSKLNGSGPDTSSTDAANLASIGSVLGAGPGQLAPGTLESLDPNEMALLSSGGGQLGYDVPQWLRTYQKGQIGTESGLAA